MTFSWTRLADYFTAVAELGAEDDVEKQRAIAVLLGLAEKTIEAPKEPAASPLAAQGAGVAGQQQPGALQASATATATASGSLETTRRPQPQRPRVEITLTPVSPEKRTRPKWIEHVLPLAPPRMQVRRPAPPQPLLAKRTSRAILATAMATARDTNTIDVDAIVETTSRGFPIKSVPRRIVPSLSHGIQVLVDRGPSSAPFLADQDLLVEQIRVVAGRDHVQVVRFDPSRAFAAGIGPRHRWIDYFDLSPRPLPGVMVVLLSDLGIATVPLESSATVVEWAAFLARIRARDNPLLAFVPYGRARWPAALRGLATILPWDRRTSIQSVRRALARIA